MKKAFGLLFMFSGNSKRRTIRNLFRIVTGICVLELCQYIVYDFYKKYVLTGNKISWEGDYEKVF